ncbi:hypothetical protein PCE1_002886 [Barthelona sp. PCE]
MDKSNQPSPFLVEALSIPTVHEIVGENSQALYKLFLSLTQNSDYITDSAFVSFTKSLNIMCENLPTTAIRHIFQNISSFYKLKTESGAPLLGFIGFIECIIRMIYDKFIYAENFTLAEKLEFVFSTRIKPLIDKLEYKKNLQASFAAQAEIISHEHNSLFKRLFTRYKERTPGKSFIKSTSLIKMVKDLNWFGRISNRRIDEIVLELSYNSHIKFRQFISVIIMIVYEVYDHSTLEDKLSAAIEDLIEFMG